MKFICTQENLHRGLLKVQGVAHQATTLPILKNILLSCKEDGLYLKSTDLEIGITTHVRGKVEVAGEALAEAKIISNFVALLPQDKVSISLEGKQLLISGGAHLVKVNTVASEEYPVIPEVKKGNGLKLLVNDFRKALLQILPAVSTDDTRPEINGVLFLIHDKEIAIVGTDSYRLGEKKLPLGDDGKISARCIVPLKTIKELIRTIDDEVESAGVYITESQIAFEYGATEMVSRLIDGEYPDYKQIIPQSFKYSFVVPRTDFLNAIKISGLLATVSSNSVTLDINPSKKLLTISSATALGEEKTSLDLDIEGDGEIKIAFDYRYLLDGLMSIDGEEVKFFANSESSPVLLAPVGSEERFNYIVMPIRQ